MQCAGRDEIACLQGQGAQDELTPRDAATLVDLSAQCEALPQEVPAGSVVASILAQPAQVNEYPGYPTMVLILAVQGQTLLEHGPGGWDVVLIQRQNSGAVEHLGPSQAGYRRPRQCQELRQTLSTLAQMATHLPKPPQHARQPHRAVDFAAPYQP